MIGHLKGHILQQQPPFLLLEVQGVGYELEAPMSTFYALPDGARQVSLFVHLVVREDAQLLFGFSDQEQRGLFRSLLRINGVGPRVALAVLSTLSPAEVASYVQREDAAALTRVPGIGKKTAQRMILDLRDRLAALGQPGAPEGAAGHKADSAEQEALSALAALGYKPAEAGRAVGAVKAEARDRDDMIRRALQFLTRR